MGRKIKSVRRAWVQVNLHADGAAKSRGQEGEHTAQESGDLSLIPHGSTTR